MLQKRRKVSCQRNVMDTEQFAGKGCIICSLIFIIFMFNILYVGQDSKNTCFIGQSFECLSVSVCFTSGSDTENDDDDDDDDDTPKKKTKKKTTKDSSPSASSAKEKKSKSKGEGGISNSTLLLFHSCYTKLLSLMFMLSFSSEHLILLISKLLIKAVT